MPTAAPDIIVRNRLIATLDETAFVSGENLFTGPVRPHGDGIPVGPVIFCLSTGGPAPQPYLDTDDGGSDLRTKSVQVTVRSAPRDYAGGRAIAAAALGRCHKYSPGGGWIDMFVREPEPLHFYDGNDVHRFVFNVDCRIVEATN